jgi:hypothetical protein
MIHYNNIINNNNFNDSKLQNYKNILVNSRCRKNLTDNTNDIYVNINNSFKYVNEIELVNYNITYKNNIINSKNNIFEIYNNTFKNNDQNMNLVTSPLYFQEILINKINGGIFKYKLKKRKIIIENNNKELGDLIKLIQTYIRNNTNQYETISYNQSYNKIVFDNIYPSYNDNTTSNIYTIDNIGLNFRNIFLINYNNYINNSKSSSIFEINELFINNDDITYNTRYNIFINDIYNKFNLFYNKDDNIIELQNVTNIDTTNIFNKLLNNLLIYYLMNSNINNNINNIHDIINICDDNGNIINNNQIYQNIDIIKLKNKIENIEIINNDDYYINNKIKNIFITIINNNINNNNIYIYINDIFELTDITNNILLNIFKLIDINNDIITNNINENDIILFIDKIINKNEIKTYNNIKIKYNINMSLLYRKILYNSNTLSNYFHEDFNETSNYNFYIFNKINDDINDITYYNEGYKISYVLGFIKDMIYYANISTYSFENNISPNNIYTNKIYISLNNYYNNYLINYIDNQYNNNSNITFILDINNKNNNIIKIKFPYDIHLDETLHIIFYDKFGNLLDTYNQDYELDLKISF